MSVFYVLDMMLGIGKIKRYFFFLSLWSLMFGSKDRYWNNRVYRYMWNYNIGKCYVGKVYGVIMIFRFFGSFFVKVALKLRFKIWIGVS